MSASLAPSSVVMSGSSVLITCTVEYDIESPINISIIHEAVDGSLYEYMPLYDSSSNTYYLNLMNVSSDKDSGNYTCSVSVHGYTMKVENVAALYIIMPPSSTSEVTHGSSMYSFSMYQDTFTVLSPSISSTRSPSTVYSETPYITATSTPGNNTPRSSLSIEMIIVLAVGLSLIFIVSIAIAVTFFILMWQNCSSKKIEISIDLPPSLTHSQTRRAKENDYINDHSSLRIQGSQD